MQSKRESGLRRRDFTMLLAAVAALPSRAAVAQPASKTYRLASLTAGAPLGPNSAFGTIALPALARAGYRIGDNLVYTPIGAELQVDRLPRLVAEIAASKPDAAIAAGYPAAAALKDAGVPTVVAAGAGDPVASGLVTSLAHPGGNITGISDDATKLSTKRLGLLKQAVPSMRKVAMLWNAKDLGMTLRYQASADAARGLGVEVLPLGIGEPNDFGDAFGRMDQDRPDAILMVSDALTLLNRKRVYEYATSRRLPAIYESDMYVRDGGLMSYGADNNESFSRAAALVVKIFQGAMPADLPFEEPTRYLFVVNLPVAKSIGLEIPANVIALADEVVE
jgi:putative ABC transport system substrate-binding protein